MTRYKTVILTVALLLLCLSSSLGYPPFQEEIPNGNRVPNPCDRTKVWEGVGHEDHRGGGPRNRFGVDFLNAGKVWTLELCRKDSDGDGKTNGEELGDPNCNWVKGVTPAVTDSNLLQHPGVCEPLTSPSCAATNSFLTQCDALGLTTPSSSSWCPSMNNPDVKSVTLNFDKAQLPAYETIYMCQQFDLPADQDYQMIAWEPVIDNRQILHHMLLFACDYGQNETLAKTPMPTPMNCRMTPPCASIVILWAYGIDGQCFPNDVGALFGKNNYQTVILQLHYDNVAQKPGYIDSSGMKLYYTNVLRPRNKGLLAFGEMYLTIPPKTAFYETPPAVMTSSCTKKMLQPYDKYYLISLLMHIHKQGVFAQVILDKKKAGYKIVILNDTFTYDRPKVAHYNVPYEILIEPGDEVSVSCGYNTLNKDDWSFFGSQTTDEMCFAFMDVYTRPLGTNYLGPSNMGADMDWCEEFPPNQPWIVRSCDIYSFYAKMNLTLGTPAELSLPTMDVLEACACNGADNYPAKSCSSACYTTMQRYNLLNDVCVIEGQAYQVAMRPFFDNSEILHRAQSQMSVCHTLSSPPPTGQHCSGTIPIPDQDGGAMQQSAATGLVIFAATVLLLESYI